MTESGTETRIDELSKRVDFGFEQTNQRLGRVEDDLRELRSEMNGRFEKTDEKLKAGFDDVSARFDDVNARFDDVNARFDDVNARFDAMNARFDAVQRLMIRFFAGTLGSIIAALVVAALMSHH